MQEPRTVTLGEVVSILFEHYVNAFGDEEIAAHATAVTVGRWFRPPPAGGRGPSPLPLEECENEA